MSPLSELEREQILFSHAFSHGNYASAYTFEPDACDAEWLEDGLERAAGVCINRELGSMSRTPRLLGIAKQGLLLGLFASFEDDELPLDWHEAVVEARCEARREPYATSVAID